MVKNFPKFILILLSLSFLFPLLASAQVYKIVFTTDPQLVNPDTLSGPITIQTQDSGGNSYQTPETIDLVFTSTSATGEFLGSTGNPATTYMSKNTANRTFYYRDSTEGTFLITIEARGRETGGEWGTTQQITISSSALQSDNSSNSSSASSSSSNSQSSGDSTTIISSAGSKLEVAAGNNRVTSPGSPIWFQATVKKNTTSSSPELNWSFGDGNIGIGSLVSHTYKYAGDYAVILNARSGNIFSVSRLKVRVIDSNISVSERDGYLEISNNGNTEINLFNWKIENNGRGFVFQPDTIILPHTSVKFDKNLLKMKGYDNSLGISLKNYIGEEVFAVAPTQSIDLSQAYADLAVIEEKAFAIREKARNLGLLIQPENNSNISVEGSANLEQANVFPSLSAEKSEMGLSAITSENVIYEAPKTEGFLSRLTNFLKRVFSK